MELLTHKGTALLETERLTLRRFTMDDAEAMFHNWANDLRVSEYMSWEPHPNAECTRELLADWIREYENENHYHWCMEYKAIGEVVGSIGVESIDEKALCGSIGYSLGHAMWGKGLMPEALRAVLRFLFAEVGFYRIQATHDVRNPKSGRVMEKCGMQYKGQSADCKQYAILRPDFEK